METASAAAIAFATGIDVPIQYVNINDYAVRVSDIGFFDQISDLPLKCCPTGP